MTVNTTQLSLYNRALKHLGERKLASLGENREPRRYLDDEYGDVLLNCLRGGLWNFAMRAVSIDRDTVTIPAFGYSSAFQKPTDWVRTSLVSTAATFDPPLRNYQDQGGYWLANSQVLYVRYVSTSLGFTVANYPADYVEYVGVMLAKAIAFRISQKAELEEAIEKRCERYRKIALANDAMDQPPGQPPLGTWISSRSQRGMMNPGWPR